MNKLQEIKETLVGVYALAMLIAFPPIVGLAALVLILKAFGIL